ncbi:acetate uptake transporter family protein [Desulfotomaculum sp. 1211_IL3151]|uniref:acetate uptake transporter family protein n=1 Tax=Desulfotomaculum sp. 1211_IL3151 TaxID=3084055 RepID=UPI002FDAF068
MSQGQAANPGPAGLVALAIACFTFYAIHTGKVDSSCAPLLGIWLIGGFVVQIFVATMELKHGNILGGNIFLFFSAFFMLVNGLELLLKFYAAKSGWVLDARIDGWAWIALMIALVSWTPAYFKTPLSTILMVLSLDIAVIVVTLLNLNVIGHEWHIVSGNFIGLGGVFGLYTAWGMIINTVFERNIIPLGAPLIKPKPTTSVNM